MKAVSTNLQGLSLALTSVISGKTGRRKFPVILPLIYSAVCRGFLFVLLFASFSFRSGAQNNACQAAFTWQINNLTVSFYSSAIPGTHPRQHRWVFADGTGSDAANPVHTFPVPGTYKVIHYVSDSLENCRDSASVSITVGTTDCGLIPAFEWRKDSSNCRKVSFVNKSNIISPNVQFSWKFGDGSGSNEINPVHEYAQQGNYTVCLVIESGSICRKEICQTVEVRCDSCSLQIDFKSEADSAFPNKIYFHPSVITPVTVIPQYKWSFGDGGYSTEANPTHSYNQPGTYSVCLRVAIGNTCVRELCKTIVVGESCNLHAKFEWKRDSLQAGKIWFFNTTVSGNQDLHYGWKFGDGSSSSEKNPVHVYTRPGTYEVCLVAESANGCRDQYCTKIEIPPVSCNLEPKFEWKVAEDNPLKIGFHNLTITTGSDAHYLWKFGDGSVSTEKDPVHLYAHPGSYEVCLVVETGNNCRKVLCRVLIIPSPECDVKARFEWKQDVSRANSIWFANVSQPVSRIWRTYWSYGDGTSSQDFNSFHEYKKAGKYLVCLKVVSLRGCADSYCDTVQVRSACDSVKLTWDYRREDNRPNRIHFYAGNGLQIKRQKWTIRRDSTVNGFPYQVVLRENNPVYTFPFTGWYTVCLEAELAGGCTQTVCERILIDKIVYGGVVLGQILPVYPNPASTELRIDLQLDRAEPVRVTVLDVQGVQQMLLVVNGQPGNNRIVLPVSKLSAGQYLVQLAFASQVKVARFQRM